MKKIMVRAWEIARTAAKKFNGSAKEYFAAALAMAWEEVKNSRLLKVVAPAKVAAYASNFVNEMNTRFETAANKGSDVAKLNRSITVLNRFFSEQPVWSVKAMMHDGNVRGQYHLIMRDFK